MGTVLGSNVFDNLWIVGVAAPIHTIRADVSEVLVVIVSCMVALALVAPSRTTPMCRTRGLLLVVAATYMLGMVPIGA